MFDSKKQGKSTASKNLRNFYEHCSTVLEKCDGKHTSALTGGFMEKRRFLLASDQDC